MNTEQNFIEKNKEVTINGKASRSDHSRSESLDHSPLYCLTLTKVVLSHLFRLSRTVTGHSSS